MNRRHFLALGLCIAPYTKEALALDYRVHKPEAWQATSINDAAMALYGRGKFSTIRKSDQIELIVPKGTVKERENIPVAIRASMKAKTVAFFQDANPRSLVAVFHLSEESIIDYQFHINMQFKGTVFAVIEGLDGKLYYAREYIDILTLSCMAS